MSTSGGRPRRALSAVIAVVIILIVGVWLGGHPGWIPSGLRGAFEQQNEGQFVQNTLSMVSRNYYRKVDLRQLVNEGLNGAVASLHDRYSNYYSPSSYKAFENETNPHLSGIGIDVLPDPKGLRVIDAFPDSPAVHAGLQHGDLITAVGTTQLAGRSSTFASDLIKGKPGTTLTLTVLAGTQRRTVSLKRARIAVPVASSKLIDYHGKKLGDLVFTSFTSGSGDELRSQVQQMLHQGAQGLILDLRSNGGGLLQEAVKVASIFIADGTIVTTKGRTVGEQVYLASGHPVAPMIPLAVLVNRETASSAEIVTGALKDRSRAKVVGTNTYGKGVFQEIQSLSNGGALDITVGEYFTPNGQNLGAGGVKQGPGIAPNVYANDNPRSLGDHQLTVAEQTVAAELK